MITLPHFGFLNDFLIVIILIITIRKHSGTAGEEAMKKRSLEEGIKRITWILSIITAAVLYMTAMQEAFPPEVGQLVRTLYSLLMAAISFGFFWLVYGIIRFFMKRRNQD